MTNIAELESNFKMDEVEQKLPDMYCQHQNPDGVLNIGYTRIGLQFSSALLKRAFWLDKLLLFNNYREPIKFDFMAYGNGIGNSFACNVPDLLCFS